MTGVDARPNVLMIVSDQERADVFGCYGGPCRTPAIDGLAADGVRFETCLAPTAICSPTRASFLTGLYPHGHGILNNVHEPDALRVELAPGAVTYPELLRDAGYRLGYVGKWHAGRDGPQARGFHDVVVAPDVVAGANDEAIGPGVLRPPRRAAGPPQSVDDRDRRPARAVGAPGAVTAD